MDLPAGQPANSRQMQQPDFIDISIDELLDQPRAIQIAYHSMQPNGKWELKWNKKNLEKIFLHERHAGKKVICISIVGNARTGKSTLLNFYLRLLGKMERREPISLLNGINEHDLFTEFINGFTWDAGNQSLTNGIWMWSRPFLMKDDHGREVVEILLDSEGGNMARGGNNAVDDACLDAQYMSICSLLSSILVYNVDGNGTPNHESLDSLLRYTKYGMVVNNRKRPFQNLLFLRRNYPRRSAGIDENMELLEILSRQPEYAIILKNPNVNVSCYKLPPPNDALADSIAFKQDFIAGKCTVEEVGRDFLEHLTRQFKLMLPMKNNGRIDDNVLKSRILETGQRHFYNCQEFYSFLKNAFETFKDSNFSDPNDFPSLWAATRAKDAALHHIKNAVQIDNRINTDTRLDLCTLNTLFNEHTSATLGIFKIVHWTCSEAAPGQENNLRGKLEHFTTEGNALIVAFQEIYDDLLTKNKKKNDPTSWWDILSGAAKGGSIGGGLGMLASFGALETVSLAALALNPITALCGFAGIEIGLIAFCSHDADINSPKYMQLYAEEMTKKNMLERLYAYRIEINMAERKFWIYDENDTLIKCGDIPDEVKSIFVENE